MAAAKDNFARKFRVGVFIVAFPAHSTLPFDPPKKKQLAGY